MSWNSEYRVTVYLSRRRGASSFNSFPFYLLVTCNGLFATVPPLLSQIRTYGYFRNTFHVRQPFNSLRRASGRAAKWLGYLSFCQISKPTSAWLAWAFEWPDLPFVPKSRPKLLGRPVAVRFEFKVWSALVGSDLV